MRQRTYLNVILTVNAVLMGGLLWTQVAATPMFATEAYAQKRSRLGPPVPTIPNAAVQRDRMLTGLRQVQRSVESISSLLRSGSVSVQVSNLDEISMDGS